MLHHGLFLPVCQVSPQQQAILPVCSSSAWRLILYPVFKKPVVNLCLCMNVVFSLPRNTFFSRLIRKLYISFLKPQALFSVYVHCYLLY